MKNKIDEIISAYKTGEITVEAANEALKAAGAIFRLNPDKNPGGGWTEAEMQEGFIPGTAGDPMPKDPDMGRAEELAGMVVAQRTVKGIYDVTYDELGYAEKAVLRK